MIQINEKIRITRLDKLNLQIETLEEVHKKDGTIGMAWKWHGYYGDLKSAINGVLKHCLMSLVDEEINGLNELSKRIDEIDTGLKKSFIDIKV